MKSLFVLTFFLAFFVRFTSADPSSQLLATINSASLQLQALGTLTLNNNTFTQLVQVLNGVFGSMAVTTVPFYNTQVATLNKNVVKIHNQLQQLTATSNMNMQMIFNLVNTLGIAYTNQIWNLGNMLNNYQNSVLPQITEIQIQATNTANAITNLLFQGNNIASTATSLLANLAETQTTQNSVSSFLGSVVQPSCNSVRFSLDTLTLGSTGLAYCKSYIYTFPIVYSSLPFVEPRIIFSAEPNSAGPNNYDLVQTTLTTSSVGIWICDRSMTSFTPHLANLLIRVCPII